MSLSQTVAMTTTNHKDNHSFAVFHLFAPISRVILGELFSRVTLGELFSNSAAF